MNIHHVLFFFFLSALCGVCAKVTILTGAEGGHGAIVCTLPASGSMKFFCKNECGKEEIVIKTDSVSAQSGRYSINYRNGTSGMVILTVTMRHLTKSDSGQYRCGVGRTSEFPDSYIDVDVRISNAPFLDKNSFTHTEIEGEDVTFPCIATVHGRQKFFCKDDCNTEEDILIETENVRAHNGRYKLEYIEGSASGMYVTIKQATKSDTGRYGCGYGRALSPDSFRPLLIVIDGPQGNLTDQLTVTSDVCHPSYFLPMVVCASLVGVSLLVVFLLLLYISKIRRNFTSNSRDMFPVIYKELAPASRNEDHTC